MNPSIVRKVLIVASVLVPLISASRWEANLGWCLSGPHHGQLHQGDFNGDGKNDLLCHRVTDGYKWIAFANDCNQFSGTNWERASGWCYHDGAELHIGDFNGDGRSDMLCHDTHDGRKWIAHANSDGNFNRGTTWKHPLGWCWHGGAQLFIGDFNGDGKDDMLCHDSNGYKWIAFANSNGDFGGGTSWERDLGWCHPPAQLFIGDFNGDGKDDMLCHAVNNGYKWIAYANSEGNFDGGTGWEHALGWCFHSGASLHIADANGDGKDDMVCHDINNGYKWVALTNANGNFPCSTTWEGALGWCYHSSAQFFLGDYNGDKNADMLCHDKADGRKWIIYSKTPIYS